MSRRRAAEKRQVLPDPIYNSVVLNKFINEVMIGGKKTVAQKIVYGALDIIKTNNQADDPLEYFQKSINNVKPSVEVKSRRVGGATFQVPMEVRPDRKVSLGMKWMIQYAKARHEKTMTERLAGEIIAAAKGEGAAVKKKDDTHRMAEANKAFSHFKF